jgi:hypothetical protein
MSILASESDRKAMKMMIVEMTNCLERIDAEKEQMKEIAEAAEEKFSIKKKFVNKMARTMYKHNYADLQQESEHFEILYETVVEGADPSQA